MFWLIPIALVVLAELIADIIAKEYSKTRKGAFGLWNKKVIGN